MSVASGVALMLFLAACTSFTGTDKAPTSDGGSGGSGALDFDTCAGGSHVTADFESNTFPPQGWTNSSYASPTTMGSVSHDTTVGHSSSSSLEAHTVTDITTAGGSLSYTFTNLSIPRGIRVRYAYKTTTSALKSSLYAEIGCDIDFNQSPDNSTEIAYAEGQSSLGLVHASQGLTLGFENDSWHQVTQELRLDASDPSMVKAALHATISTADGHSASADVASILSGALLPVAVYCGVPFSQDMTSTSTVDAWVDDISIDVCP